VIAYIDTSALLRIVLREPGALDELRSYDALVSSELIASPSAVSCVAIVGSRSAFKDPSPGLLNARAPRPR
jgi:hypothetical protein